MYERCRCRSHLPLEFFNKIWAHIQNEILTKCACCAKPVGEDCKVADCCNTKYCAKCFKHHFGIFDGDDDKAEGYRKYG